MILEEIDTNRFAKGAYHESSRGEASVMAHRLKAGRYEERAHANDDVAQYIFEKHFYADFPHVLRAPSEDSGATSECCFDAEIDITASILKGFEIDKIPYVTGFSIIKLTDIPLVSAIKT